MLSYSRYYRPLLLVVQGIEYEHKKQILRGNKPISYTVVDMSEERYMSEETHTEKLVLTVTKTYDYCDMSQETLK